MHFNKNIGTALAVAVTASAIMFPSAALAKVTFSDGNEDQPTIAEATSAVISLGEDDSADSMAKVYTKDNKKYALYDLQSYQELESVAVNVTGTLKDVDYVEVKLRDHYDGSVTLGSYDYEDKVIVDVHDNVYRGMSGVYQGLAFDEGSLDDNFTSIGVIGHENMSSRVSLKKENGEVVAVYDFRDTAKIDKFSLSINSLPDEVDRLSFILRDDFDGYATIGSTSNNGLASLSVNGNTHVFVPNGYEKITFANGKVDTDYSRVTLSSGDDGSGDVDAYDEDTKTAVYDYSNNTWLTYLYANVDSLPSDVNQVQINLPQNYSGSIKYDGASCNEKVLCVVNSVAYRGTTGTRQIMEFDNGKPKGSYAQGSIAVTDVSNTGSGSSTKVKDDYVVSTLYSSYTSGKDTYTLDVAPLVGSATSSISKVVAYDGSGNEIKTSGTISVSYKGSMVVTKGRSIKSVTVDYTLDGKTTEVTCPVKTGVQRFAGATRYDTMNALDLSGSGDSFDSTFPDNEGNVVIASGAGFADALSATGLAGALDTGIITTAAEGLSDESIAMLEDMDEHDMAYMVGGSAVVSDNVRTQLQELGFETRRLWGNDRYKTALKVEDVVQANGTKNNRLIVASGTNFADALSIAPYAYTHGAPILLVDDDGLFSTETAEEVGHEMDLFDEVIIVGGTDAVSDHVEHVFDAAGVSVERLSGDNRFETNEAINTWLNESTLNNSYEGNNVYVASATGYADALVAAPLAGLDNGTIALVTADTIDTAKAAIDGGATPVFVGGTSALSVKATDQINELVVQ